MPLLSDVVPDVAHAVARGSTHGPQAWVVGPANPDAKLALDGELAKAARRILVGLVLRVAALLQDLGPAPCLAALRVLCKGVEDPVAEPWCIGFVVPGVLAGNLFGTHKRGKISFDG